MLRVPVYVCRLVRRGSLCSPPSVTTSKVLYEVVKSKFKGLDREVFGVLMLDTGLRPIGYMVQGIGSASQCLVDVRLLMKDCLLANASAIAIAHNHPSGCETPSVEDMRLTRSIRAACETVGIKLIDHVLLYETGFYSFADSGSLTS